MSDYYNCTLSYPCSLTKEEVAEIDKICEEIGGQQYGKRSYFFEDVNHGTLPDRIADWFASKGSAFVWEYCGGIYGDGAEIYDAETDSISEWLTCDSQIVIRLSGVDDADYIARARAADKLWSSIAGPTPEERSVSGMSGSAA